MGVAPLACNSLNIEKTLIAMNLNHTQLYRSTFILLFALCFFHSKVFSARKSIKSIDTQIAETTLESIKDTLAFETLFRRYISDENTTGRTAIQQQNICLWLNYLTNSCQYIELISATSTIMKRNVDMTPHTTDQTQWLSSLMYTLGKYYVNRPNKKEFNDFLDKYQRMFAGHENDLTQYYYHILLSTNEIQAYIKDKSLPNSTTTKRILKHARKAHMYLIRLPQSTIKRYQIAPVWGEYNTALLYERSNYPHKEDSVLHYLNEAEKWAKYAKDNNDIVAYDKYMVDIYTLKAHMDLHRTRIHHALRDVRTAMSYIDANYMNKYTYEMAHVNCFKLLAQIHGKQGHATAALRDIDSLQNWMDKAYKTRHMYLVDAVIKKEHALQDVQNKHIQRANIMNISIATTFTGICAILLMLALYQKCQAEKLISAANIDGNRQPDDLMTLLHNDAHFISFEKQSQRVSDELSKHTGIADENKKRYLFALNEINYDALDCIAAEINHRITDLDKYYIICFIIEMNVEDIALLLHVEANTVYSVRYRIKKKFPQL